MASWKKYFRVAHTQKAPLASNYEGGASATASKSGSFLPEVYTGHPNRIQRYYQYEDMDRDSDVTIALNTIADFCTQSEEHSDEPFEIIYEDDFAEPATKIIKTLLAKWIKLNSFKSRLWTIFRNTLKNGDSFFLRDPETGEWLWLDHFSVMMVKVAEDNKTPEEYIVKGLDYNKQAKFATAITDPTSYGNALSASFTGRTGGNPAGAGVGTANFSLAGSNIDQRQYRNGLNSTNRQATQEVHAIAAEHVVHLSLSNGLDINWPFGQSILEPIYKTYKQKELLEDSIIIYRVQRAPERRVFTIDVGSMPPARAKAHITAIKNEIHQRRIPSRTGSGNSIMDAAYSPIAIMDDFFLAQTAEGRGSKVEVLPGGDNLGEIGDLDYFVRKLARGFNIPTAYLSLVEERASTASYQDGKLGAAVIQEYRFNKYCMRLQELLGTVFDKEFKQYAKDCGVSVDFEGFELRFNPPQNFTKYRQIELDQAQVNIYQQLSENKRLAERFKLQRFLNLSQDEILENERLWKEENANKMKKSTGASPAETETSTGLGSIGVNTGSDFNFGDGMDQPGDEEMPVGDEAGAGEAAPAGPGGASGGPAPAPGAPPAAPAV